MAGLTRTRTPAAAAQGGAGALRVAATALLVCCCLALTIHPTHAAPIKVVTDAAAADSQSTAATTVEGGSAYPAAATLPPPPPPKAQNQVIGLDKCEALNINLEKDCATRIASSSIDETLYYTFLGDCCQACFEKECTAFDYTLNYYYYTCYLTMQANPSFKTYPYQDYESFYCNHDVVS